ncbi:MAG TPA: DUF1622 domain-containing protein [Caulobacteraceae bacterium]|jgi:uncharacterized membrane protein|nr:DUF1622 domain-containing protein [Caulobacteraceae bacterium]
MESVLRGLASNIALAIELVSVLCVAAGGVLTIVRMVRIVASGAATDPKAHRTVFVSFASWIILALEFALGADIIRTAIAPTWNDIGQLAAIAGIRTVLNYFLERDVEAARREGDLT